MPSSDYSFSHVRSAINELAEPSQLDNFDNKKVGSFPHLNEEPELGIAAGPEVGHDAVHVRLGVDDAAVVEEAAPGLSQRRHAADAGHELKIQT